MIATRRFKGPLVPFVLALLVLDPPTGLVGQVPVDDQPLVIEEHPTLVLGKVSVDEVATELDSAQLFFAVKTPFMLGDDRVVVPQGHQIRVFDLDGKLVAQYGRTGSGPGEFTALSAAWARGDTLEAFDASQARVTRFRDGRVLNTVNLRDVGIGLSGLPGPLGEGWAFRGVLRTDQNGRDQIGVFRINRDGAAVRLDIPLQGFVRYESPVMEGPTPLSPRALVASHGTRLYVAETPTPEIRIFDASGHRRGTIRWKPHDPPNPSEAEARVLDLAVKQAPAERRRFVRTHIGAAPSPVGVPVLSSLLVDRDGFVWIRPYVVERDAFALGGPLADRSIGPGGSWIIFTPDGRRVGRVDVPASLELQYIGRHVVVGIRRDKLGVEYVEVHRLRRGAADLSLREGR